SSLNRADLAVRLQWQFTDLAACASLPIFRFLGFRYVQMRLRSTVTSCCATPPFLKDLLQLRQRFATDGYSTAENITEKKYCSNFRPLAAFYCGPAKRS